MRSLPLAKTGLRLFCLLFSMTAFAQTSSKIETDRPDQTETPFLTPKGWFQAEIGFNRERSSDGSLAYIHPTALSKYGFSDRFELRLITTLASVRQPAGSGDRYPSGLLPVALGGKLRIAEERGWLPKTSLIAHIAAPFASSKEFESSNWAPDFRFVMQHNLSDIFSISYNLGARWDGESDQPEWLYTFAPGANIGRNGYFYIESFAFFRKGFHPHFNYDAGFAYRLSPNVQLDISGGFGVGNSDLDNYAALGFSFRVPTRKQRSTSAGDR